MTGVPARDAATSWLAAGVCLARVGTPNAAYVERCAPWIVAAANEIPSAPPPAVVADLGEVLLGSAPDFSGALAPTPRLREALRAYEDQVLGRLVAERRLEAAVDAVARIPESSRPRAIALFLALVLERIGFEGTTPLSPGSARRLLDQPPRDVLEGGHAAIRERDPVLDRLAEGYEHLVAAARRSGQLVGDAEVFVLEHLDVLAGMGQRRALAELLDAAEWLDRSVPRHVKRRVRQRGSTATRLESESAYPMGGFASLTHSGSFENLVSSELLFMEDRGDDPVDLFVVRWAESELLFYTRDESVLARRHRALHVVVDETLAERRFKDPGVRWQRANLLLASVVVLLRRLVDWLGDRDLAVTVWVADPLERDLLSLALLELVERNVATVRPHGLAELAGALADDAPSGRVDVVWVGGNTQPVGDRGPCTLDMPHGRPVAAGPGGPYGADPDADPMEQLPGVVGEMLRDLA